MHKTRILQQRGPSSKSSPLNFATGNKIHLFLLPVSQLSLHNDWVPTSQHTPPLSFSHTTHAQILELEEIQNLNLVLAVYWHGRCKSFRTALWNGLKAKEIELLTEHPSSSEMQVSSLSTNNGSITTLRLKNNQA